jgi:hypothetical protein
LATDADRWADIGHLVARGIEHLPVALETASSPPTQIAILPDGRARRAAAHRTVEQECAALVKCGSSARTRFGELVDRSNSG